MLQTLPTGTGDSVLCSLSVSFTTAKGKLYPAKRELRLFSYKNINSHAHLCHTMAKDDSFKTLLGKASKKYEEVVQARDSLRQEHNAQKEALITAQAERDRLQVRLVQSTLLRYNNPMV